MHMIYIPARFSSAFFIKSLILPFLSVSKSYIVHVESPVMVSWLSLRLQPAWASLNCPRSWSIEWGLTAMIICCQREANKPPTASG